MISKDELDSILVSHKAQPVGNGYIDIIVKKENAHQLVESLISNGYQIDRITWWEYIDSVPKSSRYGMGGPLSIYYEGWFSEICFDDDNLSVNTAKEIMKIIDDKVITFSNGEAIEYKQDKLLTPDDWNSI
jgi:hypothetical protein